VKNSRDFKIHFLFVIILLTTMLLAGSCKKRSESRVNEAETVEHSGDEETEIAVSSTGGTENKTKKAEGTMSEKYEVTLEEKKWLMTLARDAVKAAVNGQKFDPPEPPTQLLKNDGAAFVTLRKDKQLRGCIGHIIANMPLYKCVASVARSAALEDPRFSAVSSAEYDSLHFEISVLTPPQDVKDPKKIVVGEDGVIINYGGLMHQGVFLPQVPIEQGWDLVEYLDNLCYKAGVMKKGCWKDPEAKLRKFQAVVWEEEDL